MPILSVLATLLKSRFSVIYFKCETLADEKGRKLQSLPCYAIIPPMKVRVSLYDKDTIRMPREDLTQARHTKLYNAIPPFATGLPLLSYSHTTFQNNHILPQHDENNSRLHHRGGCLFLFGKLELAYLRSRSSIT